MGSLGVYIFFTISGYLVTASWDHDRSLLRFLTRRALRIFPALIICTALTVFIAGPLLTTLSINDYFNNPHTWGYLRNTLLYISYYLPGVFEDNRVANAVNGSLWTLPIEFAMYIVVAIVGVCSGHRWAYALLTAAAILTTVFWARPALEMVVIYGSDLRQLFFCGTYFLVGAVFYKFELTRFFSISLIIIVGTLLLCLEPNTRWLSLFAWILLPTIVLAFGLAYSRPLTILTRSGDYSYGIYIYAFPVQQAVVYFYPKMHLGYYLIVCFSITLLLAVFSWHLIEKPALSFKPRKPSRTKA